MRYAEKLQHRISQVGSTLCVGIDPRPELSGGIEQVPEFLRRVVGETAEYAAAFKPKPSNIVTAHKNNFFIIVVKIIKVS